MEDFLEAGERYPNGWEEENWEQQMEEHPFFMRKEPSPGEMPPLVEALAQIKYDQQLNSKEELAINYKDDGNNNFKMKKYRWAVDCYSKGLTIGCEDEEVNSSLYNNRSAAHFYLENYRSALNDALKAIEINPGHEKAATRAVKCYFQLAFYRECIDFCENSPFKDKLKEWQEKCKAELKKVQRDGRKRQAKQRKKEEREKEVVTAVLKRGIHFQGSLFRPNHPAADGHFVHLNSQGELVWPVIFIYPEHGQTDFIPEFNENDSFRQYLEEMFPCRKYRPENVKVSFQNSKDTEQLVFVDPAKTLREVLSDSRYTIFHSVPTVRVSPIK